MPTFFLDDQPIEFSPGDTILKAVLEAGIEIPHYCYHPGLKITAQCRQCLVEITDMGNGRGMPRLQASCSTPAAEGMRVTQNSEMAEWGHKLVNEFLLVNHPLDCPICDQAGECSLQNYAFRYGSGNSEMDYEKRVNGWRDVGSYIMLERNRCVQCSRCERFSRDIVGTHDFGAFLRGNEVTFDTYQDEQITHKFQGNLADLCPVGCIMNRDWRFRKRAWKLKKTPTVCTGCATGCNITLEHHDNKVVRLRPRENGEVNRWWMCDEGRINFRQLNDRQTRPVEPLAKVGGSQTPATWDAVYQAITARVKELDASGAQVVGISDTHATNEELFLFKSLLTACGGEVYTPQADGKPQETPPKGLEDAFIWSLISTDKSPNTGGAKALGLKGDGANTAMLAALNAGPKVMFVLGDPLAGDAAMDAALAKAGLVVRITATGGAGNASADVVLPGYTSAEKWGTFINKDRRLQKLAPSIRPPAEARSQTRILSELHAALGHGAPAGENATQTDHASRVYQALAGEIGAPAWEEIGPLGTTLG